MYEVLITKPTRKLESEAKQVGFSRVFFIDQENTVLIKTNSREELRRKITSLAAKGKKIVVLGSSDELNRIALESHHVSMLLSPEIEKTKDFMKYRNSGLNHVLCKLAKKNHIAIGISLDSIKSKKSVERAELLGRIMQNVKLCRKYKTNIILASFGKKPSKSTVLKTLALTLGMSATQAKQSLQNAAETF